ncbi:hypothetical protein ANN_03343 [Periplaneta americana]|uniref:Reverse transcriptase domain-containing protein n=1 Tax=Periplaneta americana TaxID=6978 RepID=A0ABQ8U2W0_PERAM|nr:hypothetical protein ANN_03343 [Periplaneta americana]
MSEGSEIGRGVRQGCPLSHTLFNIYLEDLVKNCFQNIGGVLVEGRRINCIRFADDMALLEEEIILRDMLLELNDSCEQYEMKINANKTKSVVIGRKVKKDRFSRIDVIVVEMNNDQENGTKSARKIENPHDSVVLRRILDVKTGLNTQEEDITLKVWLSFEKYSKIDDRNQQIERVEYWVMFSFHSVKDVTQEIVATTGTIFSCYLHTLDPDNDILQQSGVVSYYHRCIMNFLVETLAQERIGRGTHITRPPRSPDLMSLDFYMWGFVKCKSVYNA